MTIEKLEEFASSGDKHLTGLDVATGFPRADKPERPWFNKLFGDITGKINEVVDSIKSLESIADLSTIINPKDGLRVYVKSYHAGLGKGGGYFTYDSSRASINDGGLVINGWIRDYNELMAPEMFGAKPNDPSFDNSEALNNALATGLDLYSTSDKTYYVTKAIVGKGQNLLGGWSIYSTRLVARGVRINKAVNTTDSFFDPSYIRTMFADSVYDLVELLDIKSLGFNLIHHYMGFDATAAGERGTVQQLLDNLKTVGMKAIIGITSPEAMDMGQMNYVAKWQGHPSVWGVTVRDEPALWELIAATDDDPSTNIDQQAEIDALRLLTKKPLCATEFKADWYRRYMPVDGYDYIFVNSYAYENRTVSEDLVGVRKNFAAIQSMYPNSKVIPCLGLFGHHLDDGVEYAQYSTNTDNIIGVADNLIKAGGGNYSVFIWDMVSLLRQTGVFDIKPFYDYLSKVKDRFFDNNTIDFYRFGCNGDWNAQVLADGQDYGSQMLVHQDMGEFDILKHLVPTYPSFDASADQGTRNMYPLKIKSGGTNQDRLSQDISTFISGIAFKLKDGQLITSIPLRKFLQFQLHYKRLGYSDRDFVDMTINIGYTTDGCNVVPLKTLNTTTLTKEFNDVVEVSNPEGKCLAISFTNNMVTDASDTFVHFLLGSFITSCW